MNSDPSTAQEAFTVLHKHMTHNSPAQIRGTLQETIGLITNRQRASTTDARRHHPRALR